MSIHPTALTSYQPMQSPALGRPTRPQPPAVIGQGTVIGAYAVIYAGATIGRNCLIGEHAVIREGCRIGDFCLIGANCFLNYEAELAGHVRLIEGVHVAGMARIGAHTFIGPRVVMSNMRRIDIDRQVFDPAEAEPPVIGERVMIGTGANLVAGIRIGDRAVIGAGAIVVKDVPAGALVRGNPARPVAREAYPVPHCGALGPLLEAAMAEGTVQ